MKKNAHRQFRSRLRNWLTVQGHALRHLEKEDLELAHAGQWPDLLKIMILLLIIFAVILVSHWLLLSKQREQLHWIGREQENLYDHYQRRALQAASLPAYQIQIHRLEETLAERLKRLPVDKEMPHLLDDIQRAAASQRLDVQLLSLQHPQARGFYSELASELRVQGEYHQLAAFMAEISSLDRIITLHDFTLQPLAAGSSSLELVVQARTYRYDQRQEHSPGNNNEGHP